MRLDTLAWNVNKISRATSSRRTSDVTVTGVDGVSPSLNDPLEPATFGLEMFVQGRDADGVIPPEGSLVRYRANLDALMSLFGVRHRLLTITQTMPDATVRRCLAKVTDSMVVESNGTETQGTFTVSLVIPSGTWEDEFTTNFTSATLTPFIPFNITNLTGATERCQDAVLLLQGPATSPRIEDLYGEGYVALGRNLSASERWRVNLATWESRVGTTLTLASLDTVGTDVAPLTTHGTSSGAYLSLTPSPALTRVTTLTTSGATGTLSVRSRRKFAL